jgi:lipopolysaccharide/colanic/teichoic acid biosynthesis glycosyltransferase
MFPLGTHQPKRRARLSISPFQSFGKRGFDMIVSTAGLLLLSPLILLISLVIRIESSGPVLSRHKRYNSSNLEFEILEFRIKRVESLEKTLRRAQDETSHTTRFGQILNRSGMDKVPQLVNVLRGEMSIVGSHLFTHPPGSFFPPVDLDDVKPGLVALTYPGDHRNKIADTDKGIHRCIDCDRFYIENLSFIFDMKIIFNILLSKSTWL